MLRLIGVTIITILLLGLAVYLWVGGATLLVAPRTVHPFTGITLRRVLALTGPYYGLCIGTCHAVVGWGLFCLQNWARWVAMVVLGIGAAVMLPLVFTAALGERGSALWLRLQMVLRAVAAFYWLGPGVIDRFVKE